jgi:hypothetical protein
MFGFDLVALSLAVSYGASLYIIVKHRRVFPTAVLKTMRHPVGLLLTSWMLYYAQVAPPGRFISHDMLQMWGRFNHFLLSASIVVYVATKERLARFVKEEA